MSQAVVCLSSALRFHELTTENPFEVWIALKQGAWTPRFEYPPIRVVRFSGPSLTFGAMEHTIEGAKIKVYSPAKTVADCFKFRSKIGMDLPFKPFGNAFAKRRQPWMNSGKQRRFVESPKSCGHIWSPCLDKECHQPRGLHSATPGESCAPAERGFWTASDEVCSGTSSLPDRAV